MRKFTSFILLLVMLITPIFSLAADYTSLSDEELLSELDQIRAEILKRTINPDNVLCDSDGIVISLQKDGVSVEEKFDGLSLSIKCVAVNNGENKLSVSIDKVAVNGWECDALSVTELDAGKKTIITVEIRDLASKTDCSSLEDIEDIEFYCYTFNPDTYERITDNLRKKVILK